MSQDSVDADKETAEFLRNYVKSHLLTGKKGWKEIDEQGWTKPFGVLATSVP